MISYDEALALLAEAQPLATKVLPLADACGHVLAEALASPIQVPSFANSAMDGFAVRAGDLDAACAASPVTLPVAGGSVAGDEPSRGHGGAWEIMTGAPLPQGYDAVVRKEEVMVEDRHVRFSAPVAQGRNIRYAGEDFRAGDAIAAPGMPLDPYHVMAFAAVGIARVAVHQRPAITVFSTGCELSDDPRAPLRRGQIHNANGPYLMAALRELSYRPRYGGTITDNPERFAAKLEEALPQADVLLSTGAVSAGKHDFIPDCLRALGAQIVFHKLAIRPGKPILYARFPDGRHYFGLPGNPISVAVGLRFFVFPLLRRLQAISAAERPISARLHAPAAKKAGLRFFAKAQLAMTSDGSVRLQVLDGQESFKIHPMLRANGWAVFTEEQSGAQAGEIVSVYPLWPGKWPFTTHADGAWRQGAGREGKTS